MNKRTAAAAIFGLSASLGLVMPGSFIVETAGPAIDVTGKIDDKSVLSVSGETTYPTDTTYMMTTVSAYGNADMGVSGIEVVRAAFDRDSQSVPVRAIYSANESADEVDKANAADMTASQDSALTVAAEAAGYEVKETLVVSGVASSSNAYNKLKAGDILTAITTGGATTQITKYTDLSTALAATTPGADVTVSYTRDGQAGEAVITTSAPETDSSGWTRKGAMLGVSVATKDLSTSVKATYAVDGIGGPSAGTMFALAIYDDLTSGSLGGHAKIAGTGTISANGEVGAIGGIPHKLQGAASEGATYFLAPATNCSETVGYEPEGMTIYAVHTFAEAVEVVKAIGAGDTSSLTTCQQVAAASQ